MGKRLPNTPRSKIKGAIRQLWLRSRERAAALKREGYKCERCGAKQSRIKGKEVYLEVHHKDGIDWDGVVDIIAERILQTPENLEVTCKECHDKEHGRIKKETEQ